MSDGTRPTTGGDGPPILRRRLPLDFLMVETDHMPFAELERRLALCEALPEDDPLRPQMVEEWERAIERRIMWGFGPNRDRTLCGGRAPRLPPRCEAALRRRLEEAGERAEKRRADPQRRRALRSFLDEE